MNIAFEIELTSASAAFEDDPTAEVSRILRKVANLLDAGHDAGPLVDSNGNTCGHWALTFTFDAEEETDVIDSDG